MNGILILDKPPGCTSHDMVFRVRKQLGEKYIGHLGTLDPLATGVLPLVVGNAARLAEFVPAGKTYEAACLLDRFTSSDDVTGDPLPLEACASPDEDAIRQACLSLTDIKGQIPPMVSAVKIDGHKMYELARKGITVDRPMRPVEILSIEVLSVEWPRVVFRVSCSGGTYVRSLCRTLGERLGTGGCLENLRRLKAGPFGLDEAITLQALEESLRAGQEVLRPAVRLVEQYPCLTLSAKQTDDILHGRSPDAPQGMPEGWVTLLNPQGRIVAMAQVVGVRLRPKKVFGTEGI
jgi:tRNA pseudouridine55 synthase